MPGTHSRLFPLIPVLPHLLMPDHSVLRSLLLTCTLALPPSCVDCTILYKNKRSVKPAAQYT